MKTKKLIILSVTIIMLINMSLPTLAYNYSFESGVNYKDALGSPTNTDNPVSPDPMQENTRRNKDAAYMPPPYFYGSGDIPTDPSSLYHDNSAPYSVNTNGSGLPLTGSDSGGTLPPTSLYTHDVINTQPLYYNDGSIGTLEFPRFNKTIKVFEGESLENMLLGAGHFESTSAWDGNCAIAAHNRGVPNNFIFLKDMTIGDKVNYVTKYGQRTYEVISKTQISADDTSGLAWSSENLLSLYTCVENVPSLRLLVVCRETAN